MQCRVNFPARNICDGRRSHGRRGFSLVEVVISMFVLAIFVLAFTQTLIFTKYQAEDNLYAATALTVGVSAIEQMKSVSLARLESPPNINGKPYFRMEVMGQNSIELFLDEANSIEVPIVTEEGGNTEKTMTLEITPSLQKMVDLPGYWIEITYAYAHPQTGRIRTEILRNARSDVRR
jgi:prepilin-type N-terminal cleavage/methylation domain-containing protein